MTCLMTLADKVLREDGAFSAQDSRAQNDKAKLFIWFLNRPGLPLSVVAGAVEQCSPQTPMILLSDVPEVLESPSQTVDAVITRSDGPSVLMSMLQSLSDAEPLPVVQRYSCTTSNAGCDDHDLRILDDLKSLIDSFGPSVRRHLITESS